MRATVAFPCFFRVRLLPPVRGGGIVLVSPGMATQPRMDTMTNDTAANPYVTRAATVSAARADLVARAITLGADAATLDRLIDAVRIADAALIVVSTRYGNLSRGKSWGRQGSGKSAVWAERNGADVVLTPGKWTVGSDDGFSRKDSTTWDVEHVTVGTETWTIAN